MAAPFVVACSHCGSKLKLKDASFAGKKVRCPKCQEPFVVPVPKKQKAAAPADSSEFLSQISEDDYGAPPGEEDDDFGELPPSPVRRKAAAAKGKGKKKRRASSGPPVGKIALIALLVLLGVSVLGGGVYGIIKLVGSLGGAGGRMAWLPANTEMLVEVRVADVWNSQALQPLTGGEIGQRIAEGLKTKSKVDLQDIERIVVGSPINSRTPTVVVYANGPIDVSLIEGEATASEYGGYTLYTDAAGRGVGFLPSPEVVVFGPETEIKAAIDRKGECPVADQFGFAPSGDIVIASIKPGGMTPRGAGMNVSPMSMSSVTAAGGAIDFSSDINASFILQCSDAGAAEKLTGEMQSSLSEAQTKLQEQKTQLQPNPFMDVAKLQTMMERQQQIMQSVAIAQSGSNVRGSVKIPGAIIQDAVDSLGPMLPLMMQSLPGAGGPGFTPPPSPGITPPSARSGSSAPVAPNNAHGEPVMPAAGGPHAESTPPPSGAGGHGEAAMPAIPAGAHGEAGARPAGGGAHAEPGGRPAGGGAHIEAGAPPGTAGALGEGQRPPAGAGAHAEAGAPPGRGAHGEAGARGGAAGAHAEAGRNPQPGA